MNSKIRATYKRASLAALSVLIGALFFNINIGNAKMSAVPEGTTPDPGAMYYDAATGGINTFTQNASGGYGWAPVNDTNSGFTQVDPNIAAQQQAQAQAAAQAQANYNTSANNITDTAKLGLSNWVNNYNTQAIGLNNKYGDAQKGINTSRENIELNRMGGMTSLADKVRQGVQSGAVGLANRNASDSSGAEGLARGWQRYGNQQASAINADTFNQNRGLDDQQATIVRDKEESLRQLHVSKEEQVASVQQDTQAKLEALDAEAANQGITGRVQIGVLKQQVVQDALGKLGELDNWLNDQLGQHQALGREQVIQNAGNLQAAGRQGDNPYQLQGPQVAIQGAPISQLPLYTQKRRQD